MTELYIVMGAVLGLLAGVCINAKGIEERDQRITELENVCQSNNETINRLRRENERLKKRKDNENKV